MTLAEAVKENKKSGCFHINLGGVPSVPGYAIMAYEGFYFWVDEAGQESVKFCDRWDCYRAAKYHKENESKAALGLSQNKKVGWMYM